MGFFPTFSLKSASTVAVPSFSFTVIFHFDDAGLGRDNKLAMYALKGDEKQELNKLKGSCEPAHG